MEWRQVLAVLRDLGCEVRLASGGEPLDVVVIDGPLVWCGDTAPLAYPPRRDDCALRLVSRGVAAELVKALKARGTGRLSMMGLCSATGPVEVGRWRRQIRLRKLAGWP